MAVISGNEGGAGLESMAGAAGVYDIAVVGAGPCGLSVGVAARRAGVSCVLFDKGCVTRAISLYPTYGTFFSTPDKLELGGVPFITAGDKPTRREALKYYRAVVSRFGLDVRQYEEVTKVTGQRGAFLVHTLRAGRESTYRARAVVVATGYFDTPNLLGVPGEELPKVSHYYREGLPFFGQECLVVGGGNSAAEAALDLHRSGARVTLVHFLGDVDPGVKPWILPDLRGRLQSGEVAARWRTRVEEIRPESVVLARVDSGRRDIIPNDFVFAMTGWTPDPKLLRRMGVPVDPTSHIPEHDPETMETARPGVYIAGVIAAGCNKTFIENGREHGPRIVAALTDPESRGAGSGDAA